MFRNQRKAPIILREHDVVRHRCMAISARNGSSLMEEDKPPVYDLDKEIKHNREAMDRLRQQLRISDATRVSQAEMNHGEKAMKS
jgi:hypothetical protein